MRIKNVKNVWSVVKKQKRKDWVMQAEHTTPAPEETKNAMLKILERNPYLFDPEKDRIKWVRPRSLELWARLTKENDND